MLKSIDNKEKDYILASSKLLIMKAKNCKRAAAKTLETVAKWIKKSRFDYDPRDLKKLLNEAQEHYKNYLKRK